jgi:hypothetical protein
LRVAHYAFTVAGTGSRELASGHQRRFWGAGISAASGHGVSEIDAAGFHPNQLLVCSWRWFRNIADLKDLWPALTSNDDRFHR